MRRPQMAAIQKMILENFIFVSGSGEIDDRG
jgi:hypothetical protein